MFKDTSASRREELQMKPPTLQLIYNQFYGLIHFFSPHSVEKAKFLHFEDSVCESRIQEYDTESHESMHRMFCVDNVLCLSCFCFFFPGELWNEKPLRFYWAHDLTQLSPKASLSGLRVKLWKTQKRTGRSLDQTSRAVSGPQSQKVTELLTTAGDEETEMEQLRINSAFEFIYLFILLSQTAEERVGPCSSLMCFMF